MPGLLLPPRCLAHWFTCKFPPFQPSYTFNDVSFDDPWGSIGIPSPFPAQYGSNVPGPEATFVTPVSLYYMQKDFRIPQIATWNLMLERQSAPARSFGGLRWQQGDAPIRLGRPHPAQEGNPAIYILGLRRSTIRRNDAPSRTSAASVRSSRPTTRTTTGTVDRRKAIRPRPIIAGQSHLGEADRRCRLDQPV